MGSFPDGDLPGGHRMYPLEYFTRAVRVQVSAISRYFKIDYFV